MKTSYPLTVLCIVKENISRAAERYARAAKRMDAVRGPIFEQLSDWERVHYARLVLLERSLQEKGDLNRYPGKQFILPRILEKGVTDEPAHKSMVEIISDAMQLEEQAEKVFALYAVQLAGTHAHQFFIRLAEEEHRNYRALSDALWSVNQTGVWNWSHPGLA